MACEEAFATAVEGVLPEAETVTIDLPGWRRRVARGLSGPQSSPDRAEEPDVSSETDATDGDWLDASCWGCGTDQAYLDGDGRLLCPLCRVELSGAPPAASDDPLRVAQGAYWEAHATERCWRCLTGSVDPDDQIGLCRACRVDLSAKASGG
jgi:hypothetical protein